MGEERSHRSLGQVPPLGSASTCVIRGGAAVRSHNVQVFRSVGGKENEAKQRVACALPSTKYRAGGCLPPHRSMLQKHVVEVEAKRVDVVGVATKSSEDVEAPVLAMVPACRDTPSSLPPHSLSWLPPHRSSREGWVGAK